MELTGKQKHHLRALGHHLDPVVWLGKNGLDAPQLDFIDQALWDHELIKVKVGKSAPFDVKEMIEIVEAETGALCVQKIGKLGMFFRPNADEPKIRVPGFKADPASLVRPRLRASENPSQGE